MRAWARDDGILSQSDEHFAVFFEFLGGVVVVVVEDFLGKKLD